MKTTLKILGCLCLLSAPAMISFPAHAEETAVPKVETGVDAQKTEHKRHGGFDRLDTDKDGAITKAESDAHFAKLDADKDGKISQDEWKSHMQEMRKDFKGKHKGKWKEKMKEMCDEADKAEGAETSTPTEGAVKDE